MEELGFMWHTEGMDEVNLRLQYTTIELESVKMKANEQMMKHKEDMRKLLTLLQIAYQERDEAKDQLQKLLNKLMVATSPAVLHPQKANSSITESNSLSDTYNHHSHISSPVVDSFFDAAPAAETSPEFSVADSSNLSIMNQHQPQIQPQAQVHDYRSSVTKTDPATAVIDAIAKGKPLPEKGKFLQSVMESGPLLQTLLLAGPLPRWRNPPPLEPFNKLPPVSINGCDSNQSYLHVSRVNSNLCSRSMLNFSSSAPVSGYGTANFTAGAAVSTAIPFVKRQRIQ